MWRSPRERVSCDSWKRALTPDGASSVSCSGPLLTGAVPVVEVEVVMELM